MIEAAAMAILGGIFYDAVKYGTKNLIGLIKDKSKEQLPSWQVDEQTLGQIANRVESLGYDQSEDKTQYQQRIFSDPALSQLLQIAVSTNHTVNQTVNHSKDTRMAAGDYHESHVHYHGASESAEPNTTKKS
ncbi:MAG: hypothetical protein HRT35_31045 [Algicola sp.]|nr:hypothetical protein [Algicola sp.]